MSDVPNELIPTRWSLIRRLKNWDDQESWREFFEIYWTLIYGTARKAGLGHADAEEVVQNTVVEVSKRIQAFQADPARGSFKAWLLQQTRWRIADQARGCPLEERARVHRPAASRDSTGGSTPTEERLPDTHQDPLEVAWDVEWEKTLTDATLELVKRDVSARDLQVFVMVALQGASPETVAQLHQLQRNNVDQIKHRVGRLFEKAAEKLKQRWA